MAAIGLLSPDPDDRDRLILLAGESGHMVRASAVLLEAVELLREGRPRLMMVVDGHGQDAAMAVREVLRVSPLLPVVVVQKERDAGRAVELMRMGAAEVVAPPWTKETLRACLAKTLRYQGTAFSVVHPAPLKRSAAVYFFALLLFFAAGLGTSSLRRRELQARQALEKRSYWDLPYKHPAGLAFDGKSLWVADWFSQSLYAHDPESAALRSLVHFTSETPIAVAFAGDAAWSVTASGTVVRHLKDAKLTVVERYRDAAPHTVGLVFDGLYLWTSDTKSRRLRKRLTDATLSVAGTYPYPGVEPAALAFDGKTIWSLDSANRQLLRHNLERPEEVTGSVPLPEYKSGQYRPVGLAWDGERFWTVGERLPRDSGPARLFRHAAVAP